MGEYAPNAAVLLLLLLRQLRQHLLAACHRLMVRWLVCWRVLVCCVLLLLQSAMANTLQLGLLLGTKIWFRFYDVASLDTPAVDARIEGLAREIGERGQASTAPRVPEAIPPVHAPSSKRVSAAVDLATAPASAPAPAPVSAPALAAVAQGATVTPRASLSTTTLRSFSPSVHVDSSVSADGLMRQEPLALPLLSGGGIAELTALLREERAHMKEERKIMDDKTERMQAKMDALREEVVRAQIELATQRQQLAQQSNATDGVSEHQLEALQSRLQALRSAQLLSEDEVFCIEDLLADCIELGPGAPAAFQVQKIVQLSEKISADGSFARQVRRKFAPAR
jgi:hypothetical protein